MIFLYICCTFYTFISNEFLNMCYFNLLTPFSAILHAGYNSWVNVINSDSIGWLFFKWFIILNFFFIIYLRFRFNSKIFIVYWNFLNYSMLNVCLLYFFLPRDFILVSICFQHICFFLFLDFFYSCLKYNWYIFKKWFWYFVYIAETIFDLYLDEYFFFVLGVIDIYLIVIVAIIYVVLDFILGIVFVVMKFFVLGTWRRLLKCRDFWLNFMYQLVILIFDFYWYFIKPIIVNIDLIIIWYAALVIFVSYFFGCVG